MNVPSQHPLEPSADGAAEAVRALRAALVEGDVEGTQAHRWLAPRPPGERDLLSDLAAAEGITPAVRRLSRFWRRAEVHLERVRSIDAFEAEVYERVVLPGESLPIVSLVRREGAARPWGVVCTNEAHDERFTLWVAVEANTIDDVAWSRAFDEPGSLLMTDDGGVLGHSELGWLVHVRGPYRPAQWPENLSGEGGRLVELAVALAPEPEARREQLRWMLAAVVTTLEQLGGQAAYRPVERKLLLPEAVRLAARSEMAPGQAYRFWARTRGLDGFVCTEGLHLLGLPEVEAPEGLLDDAARTRRVVEWLGTNMTATASMPALGTELLLGDRSLLLVAGRRGPRRGTSYGRWGAYRLLDPQRSDPSGPFARGSRTRMRVPPEVLG